MIEFIFSNTLCCYDFYVLLPQILDHFCVFTPGGVSILVERVYHDCIMSVSTPVGDSILVERVYHDCTISVNHKSTMTEFVEFNMINFDFILGMYYLHSFNALVDCRT